MGLSLESMAESVEDRASGSAFSFKFRAKVLGVGRFVNYPQRRRIPDTFVESFVDTLKA